MSFLGSMLLLFLSSLVVCDYRETTFVRGRGTKGAGPRGLSTGNPFLLMPSLTANGRVKGAVDQAPLEEIFLDIKFLSFSVEFKHVCLIPEKNTCWNSWSTYHQEQNKEIGRREAQHVQVFQCIPWFVDCGPVLHWLLFPSVVVVAVVFLPGIHE